MGSRRVQTREDEDTIVTVKKKQIKQKKTKKNNLKHPKGRERPPTVAGWTKTKKQTNSGAIHLYERPGKK